MSSLRAPEHLYRGITVNPDVLNDAGAFYAILNANDGLRPGSLKLNEQGEQSVFTGDEYGVYMSPSPTMAESYGFISVKDQLLGFGQPMTLRGQTVDYEIFHPELGNVRTTLTMPSLGVIYKIRSEGLPGLRLPKYRKGRAVTADELTTIPEWIADYVPAANVRPASIMIGPDIIDSHKTRFNPDTDSTQLHRSVSRVFAARLGNLAFLSDQLNALPDRYNTEAIGQALALARSLR
jgi:hypothetical protein